MEHLRIFWLGVKSLRYVWLFAGYMCAVHLLPPDYRLLALLGTLVAFMLVAIYGVGKSETRWKDK